MELNDKQNIVTINLNNSQGTELSLQNINKALVYYFYITKYKKVSAELAFTVSPNETQLKHINEMIIALEKSQIINNIQITQPSELEETFTLSAEGVENYYSSIVPIDRISEEQYQQNYKANNYFQKSISKKHAAYKCEVNPHHITFLAKSNNFPYVEGHHLVPKQFRKDFDVEIDVAANIVAVCPICHTKIHKAINNERKELIIELYNRQKNYLLSAGINITLDDLLKLYGCF